MNKELSAAFNIVGLSCEQNQTVGLCGDNINTYCIHKDISPSNTEITQFKIEANLKTNSGLGFGISASIEITIHDNPCISPEIYFDIDLDNKCEYIDVFEADINLIERYGSNSRCGQGNTTCIKQKKLGIVFYGI